MASIFKQQYTAKDPKTGKRVKKKSKFWYVDYKGLDGIRKRVKGYKDKQATAQLAARLEREAELAAEGIVDRFKEHRKRPLKEHLADFKASLIAKGNTSKHANLVYARAKKVVGGCRFALWSDISSSSVQRYLAQLRKDKVVESEDGKKTIKGISPQTFNFYLQAIKQFCRWMVQDRRAESSPLEHLSKVNTKTDRRHDRRALDPAEIQSLLEATVSAPERFGMKPHDRGMLYRLAIETGLRASEMRSLKVSSFDLQNRTVSVKAAYCKNRQEATLPLKKETCLLLEKSFAGKLPEVKAFSMPTENYLAKMLRKDLEDAEIEYKDASERYVDFHALRHTAGSLLAASGVHPKVAQSIMRHSDINLTMSRYSHVFSGQESEAIENLPTFSLAGKNKTKATGTDGRADEIAYKPAYKKLAKKAYSGFQQSSMIGTDRETGKDTSPNVSTSHKALNCEHLGNKKTPLSAIDNGVYQAEEEGFEPPVRCRTTVFKTATLSHSVTPPSLSISST